MNSTPKNKRAYVEKIYREYKQSIYNFIYRLCHDPEQAMDVTQQTFIKIITNPDLKEIENIKSFLFTIARNYLYDTWKKKKELLLDDASIDITSALVEGKMTDELEKQQLQNAVVFCVQRLTDKYREIMVLRYMEDLSIKEIAAITKRSISDIKVSLLRGRQKFNQGLTKHMYLKVAKSRQRCEKISAMLAPYGDSDIAADELNFFEKHIDQCTICAEDAQQLKCTRQLFALIPLFSIPLALDSSFNDAMAASNTSKTAMSNTNSITKTMVIKIAVSVTVFALIVGAVFLVLDKNNYSIAVKSPQIVQQKAANPQSEPVSPSNQSATPEASISLIANTRLASDTTAIKVHWLVYRLNSKNKSGEQVESLYVKELRLKLAPGKYRILAQIDDVEIEKKFLLEQGKPLSLNLLINRGSVNISTPLLVNSIKLYDSQVTYFLYKSKKDLERNKYLILKKFREPKINFTLVEGDYYIKASYTGFGDIETIQSFTVKAGKTKNIEIPIAVGLFKPDAQLSSKNLSYSKYKNTYWSAKKISAPQNTSTNSLHFRNGDKIVMAPGSYILTTKLENISQQSNLIIKSGKVTPHQVILGGGIVKSAVWSDNSRSKRSSAIYVQVYDFKKYKERNNGSIYLENLAALPNQTPDSFSILAEGKYILVVKNKLDHKVSVTRQFTIKDGDSKFIQLVLTK